MTRSLGMTFVFHLALICHCDRASHLIHRKCGPPSPQGEGYTKAISCNLRNASMRSLQDKILKLLLCFGVFNNQSHGFYAHADFYNGYGKKYKINKPVKPCKKTARRKCAHGVNIWIFKAEIFTQSKNGLNKC